MTDTSIITIDRICSIIKEKKSNICLAADVKNTKQLFDIIEELGDKICILKIHYDIIEDFHINLEETISKLNYYKQRFNFLIWEDRKFADIGMIMIRQIKNNICRWADIISVHSVMGLESIKCLDFIAIILIGELSTKDCIIDANYIIRSTLILESLDNIVGVVCQNKIHTDKLKIVPGISLQFSEDGMGQQHTPITNQSKNFADIYVIGRGILQTKSPRKTIDDYLTKISI
jgi:uridine monophosphate synthetase